MRTLHLVSHTHWDREWYLTFQQFRLKLVHLIDGLLDILEQDKNYKYFMLDGQTIVLDDYLLMRPEKEDILRKHIQKGRIVIGPWHILPDEFLVSPEATIRNLLQGGRTCRKFGPKMMVGYIPDPFGHIGQMPQILRGFGIETACVQRGLADEPCEFWWEAPDGSRVFMAYLRDGYGNAALLPASEPERFTTFVREARDNLAPHSSVDHLLLMYGTDHMEPSPETSQAIAYTHGKLDGDQLIHSTLPAYIAAAQKSLRASDPPLPVLKGELRQCKRSHLLPGVLSARMWIKQRNQACETLMEKWVEPFSTFAGLAVTNVPTTALRSTSPLVRQAWRLLMENHPHDSICGCSIDQVHDEMKVRFDQVEQIGEELTKQSLESLAAAVDVSIERKPSIADAESAIIVFNPTNGPRTDLVTAKAEFQGKFEIVDEEGNSLPYQMLGSNSQDLVNAIMSKKELKSGLTSVHEGRILGRVIRGAAIQREGSQADIDVLLADSGELDLSTWERGMGEIEALLADPEVTDIHVRAHSISATEFIFTAREVPGYGYKTFWLRPVPESSAQPVKVSAIAGYLMPLAIRLASSPLLARLFSRQKKARPPYVIENEYFHVEASPADGTLTVKDKRNGAIYRGLNRFRDGGDCGDEYNYSPPPSDLLPIARLRSASLHSGAVQQTLELHLELKTPAELSSDRKSRSRRTVTLPITSTITLSAGVPRVDIATEIDNLARDHRLRVHFPAPFAVTEADYDGHFEVIRRPTGLPEFDETWVERPRPEKPQRLFTDISDGKIGLMIANRGLPEVEVISLPETGSLQEKKTAEIALTLLRCINWISRDDFTERKGHAGPMTFTPGAQMFGRWMYEYSIIPHAGDWQESVGQAHAFATPLRATSTILHGGALPPNRSFIEVTPASFIVSAIKRAEDEKGWLVRGYNITGEEIEVSLRPWRLFKKVERVNLAEESLSALKPGQDGKITFKAHGHEIASVKFS